MNNESPMSTGLKVKHALFISYKFVKGFLAITFLLLVIFLFLAETFMMCVNVFSIQPETKFQLDPTKNEKYPHRPIYIYINRPLL